MRVITDSFDGPTVEDVPYDELPEWVKRELARIGNVEAKYSPDQPRDDHGRSAEVDGSGDASGTENAIIGVPSFSDLSPRLQGKMQAKLEAMTGLPFESLTAEMRDNLGALAAAEWQKDPSTAYWYHQYHDAAVAKVAELNATAVSGAPRMTEPKYEAMMSVTSALNDPEGQHRAR